MSWKKQEFQDDARTTKKPQRWGWRRLRKAVVPLHRLEHAIFVSAQGVNILKSLNSLLAVCESHRFSFS